MHLMGLLTDRLRKESVSLRGKTTEISRTKKQREQMLKKKQDKISKDHGTAMYNMPITGMPKGKEIDEK